jgi:hypothetical protein
MLDILAIVYCCHRATARAVTSVQPRKTYTDAVDYYACINLGLMHLDKSMPAPSTPRVPPE